MASCTLLKFALLSVGDTYSVPSGHPVRGEEDASFCNWHAMYSEERAWACKPRLAETAKRTARRIKPIDSDMLPIGGSMVLYGSRLSTKFDVVLIYMYVRSIRKDPHPFSDRCAGIVCSRPECVCYEDRAGHRESGGESAYNNQILTVICVC